MKIDDSINALRKITEDLNKIPARITDAIHNPESNESLDKIATDMMMDENNFKANIQTIKTMSNIEKITLDLLRK